MQTTLDPSDRMTVNPGGAATPMARVAIVQG
jgi:hypothetical protein